MALLRVVEAIWEGRLRAEKLKVDQSHQLMGVPAFPSGFICKVCDLIRSSTNVGALFVRSSEFGLLISCAQPLPSQDSTRWISNPPWSAHCQRNRSMP